MTVKNSKANYKRIGILQRQKSGCTFKAFFSFKQYCLPRTAIAFFQNYPN